MAMPDPGPPARPDARRRTAPACRRARRGRGPGHPVGVEQRLPRTVGTGQGARVGGHHGPTGLRRADRQGDDGHVELGGAVQGGPQAVRVAQGLEDEPDHPGLLEVEGVPEVVRGPGHELLAGRHHEGEAEVAPRPQQCREHRARVGDEGDGPGRERVAFDVADGPEAPGHVDEPHAATAAQGHAGRPRRGGDPVADGRRRRVVGLEQAAEDDGGAVPPGRGGRQLLLDVAVADPQEHQVDRAVDLVERVEARPAEDLVVAGVDQVDLGRRRAPGDLGHHPVAEAPVASARPDHGDPPGLQHGPHGRVDHAGYLARSLPATPSADFLSARAARTACQPGMPHTPPPAWVAELPL